MKNLTWREVRRYINRALAGVNYLLTLAVSVIVIIIAIVLFRALVDDPGDDDTPAPTTTRAAAPVTSAVAVELGTTRPSTTIRPPQCVGAEPDPGSDNRNVRVFFACGQADVPTGTTWVYRQVPQEDRVIPATVRHLVAGPTPDERRDGFRSLFTPATADAVIEVSRDGGDVVVDLRALGPMPSITAGDDGPFFLADLNNTVFQHEVVETVEYRIEGSCDDFWSYFGEAGCVVIERSQWSGSDGAAAGL